MSWQDRRLGELVKLRSGGTPRKSEARYWDGDIPWLSSKDLTTARIYDAPVRVTDEGASNGTRLMPENTVMFVVRGMSLASEFRVSLTKTPCTFNQDLKAVECCAEISSEFLYYSLFALREQIRGRAGEASHGTKKLETNTVENLLLKVPDRAVQERVVDVASAYDDLIDNNRRRIALLEEAARMLYREWFVHFRFPGHEHVKIIDGIPEGWDRKRIEDHCAFLGRGISPKYDDEGEYTVINQKCIRDRLLSFEPARRQSKEFKSERALRHLDVLINSTGTGTLGRVAQCWVSPEYCTFDSHVTVARATDEFDPRWFGYAMMELQPRFEDMGEGATNQKELSKTRIGDSLIVLPPGMHRQRFAEFAADTTGQIATLAAQIINLAQARDILLPRLMNGEIAV